MLENKSTRGTKRPAAAAKKAVPKVAVKSAPIGGNGEVSPSRAAQETGLFDTIPDLVKTLVENIRHNTELLKQIDQRRDATQTADRAPVVEQLRTILNYKAIGQVTGRSGSAFLGNLISADRDRVPSTVTIDRLIMSGLPDDAKKVSVQVDGVQNAEVKDLSVNGGRAQVDLVDARGKDIGRIEILNNDNAPIRLGPRMVAVPLDQ